MEFKYSVLLKYLYELVVHYTFRVLQTLTLLFELVQCCLNATKIIKLNVLPYQIYIFKLSASWLYYYWK